MAGTKPKRQEKFDADWEKANQGATSWPTIRNICEVRCRDCNGIFYIDTITNDRLRMALEYDPTDNRFICDKCRAGI